MTELGTGVGEGAKVVPGVGLGIVIPTLNEAENIGPLISDLLREFPSCAVVVVDGGSRDGTRELLEAIAADDDRVRVVMRMRSGERSLGEALRAGLQAALALDARHVAMMDADRSHRSEDLRLLMQEASRSGADLAIGSRFLPGARVLGRPPARSALSRLAAAAARAAWGLELTDPTSGLRVLARPVVEDLLKGRLDTVGFAIHLATVGQVVARGAHIVEVPITFVEHRAGSSKMKPHMCIEGLKVLWRRRDLRRRERR
jgi:dolichol-phosphate mannosyltransferase